MPSETRQILMAEAETIVRRHGYAGFSYAQLAEAVGIRKPSIHHHFPSKEDLVTAIMVACCVEFGAKLDEIATASADLGARLEGYASLYRDTLHSGVGCICGVLACEVDIVPGRVRDGVQQFLRLNIAWIERVLNDADSVPAAAIPGQARLVLATMQGALLTARALGDGVAFESALSALKQALLGPQEAPQCH